MDIIIEHVRSFSERQVIPLKPLTLPVGENSSGKSTFLAIVSAILDATRFPDRPNFNIPPYNLGPFETIATSKRGKNGRDLSFTLGFKHIGDSAETNRELIVTCVGDSGNVVAKEWHMRSWLGTLDVETRGLKFVAKLHPAGGKPVLFDFRRTDVPRPLLIGLAHTMEANASKRAYSILKGSQPPYGGCYSFAPIRSKPKRTYDEWRDEYSPEGDHVPALLAKLSRLEHSASSDAVRVKEALLQFGKESGLFKRIDVRSLGKQVSDPFQIQVNVAGLPANLIDVGYGVSQALPLVVQSMIKTSSNVFLMQQPEVHLHPRAQAALGSFFAQLVPNEIGMIIIETHSDYLVDRVRQEVAKGTISPENVQILYFHKPELETTVYPIALDKMGNVLDAPPEYRSFFMEEERNLLFRGDK